MSYYDNSEEYDSRGIDWDLVACLEYNPQDGLTIEDIDAVLAVWEGERDGDDWRWILLLKNGKFAFLQGGCDYTGWDCQSWATHIITDTAEEAAEKALGDVPVSEENHPANAGFGHMLGILSGSYFDRFTEVRDNLLEQLKEGKHKTWTESKSEEFKEEPTFAVSSVEARILELEAALREIANYNTTQSYHDEYDAINAVKTIAQKALEEK